jgi:hypothetical protein
MRHPNLQTTTTSNSISMAKESTIFCCIKQHDFLKSTLELFAPSFYPYLVDLQQPTHITKANDEQRRLLLTEAIQLLIVRTHHVDNPIAEAEYLVKGTGGDDGKEQWFQVARLDYRDDDKEHQWIESSE